MAEAIFPDPSYLVGDAPQIFIEGHWDLGEVKLGKATEKPCLFQLTKKVNLD